MAKRSQPVWHFPKKPDASELYLYNSLTRNKEIFIPQSENSILWYCCGPTVYDASHMGHARTYISFDIIRRVLSDYFGYDVSYAMNITDIDDKIIKRARQNYLYEKYVEENNILDKIVNDMHQIMSSYKETVTTITDPDKKNMMEKMLSDLTMTIDNLEKAIKKGDDNTISELKGKLLEDAKTPLCDWLDKIQGSTITEHSIFNKLSQHWESEFHKDMDALNVLKPSILVRVSEYISEIIAFIQGIISNGFAYESNGSVYFNVSKFDDQEKHMYAKLVPEAYGDTLSIEEGEGDLSITKDKLLEKKSETDFALWKSSKAGEPSWDSPWGNGRPGWHIECSVMAHTIFRKNLDIHSGGVDLKFPHHDNEIAQAEAYFNSDSWVNYFLHSGHLTIADCKMSKSLKNFITIQEALKKHTARQLRIAFLLHSWKDTLDYSDNTMNMAVQYEKFLNEFFLTVKCKIRSLETKNIIDRFGKWTSTELEFNKKFYSLKQNVHKALCDNIDTKTVLDDIRTYISECNTYMNENKNPNMLLLEDIAKYITKMFVIFGAITSPHDSFGFPIDDAAVCTNVEKTVMPYLEILSNFRENVRISAKKLKAYDILQVCDTLRDEILPNIGVRLEDSNGETYVKLVNKEQLLKEKEAKKALQVEKTLQKKGKKSSPAETKEEQKKIPPIDMFKLENKYSQFDDKGLPTHDADGKEISKNLLKKLQKRQQAQEKIYNEYLNSVQNNV